MNIADFPRVKLVEAIGSLAAMPRFVADAIERAPAAALAFKPGPEDFGLTEQACHLRDLEREGYLVRVRRMLAEEVPALARFDGAAVAAERDYPAQDARAAARDFAAARSELTAMLAALSEAQLAREAVFADRRICLADLVSMIVEHDRGHREEIERLVRTLGQ